MSFVSSGGTAGLQGISYPSIIVAIMWINVANQVTGPLFSAFELSVLTFSL